MRVESLNSKKTSVSKNVTIDLRSFFVGFRGFFLENPVLEIEPRIK